MPSRLSQFDRRKLAILLAFGGLAAIAWFGFRDRLSIQFLVEREAQLTTLAVARPWLFRAGAFGLYVLVTGLSLPGAAVMSMIYGWFFGFWEALPMISFASTGGAVIAFLIARYLLRDWVESRFGERAQKINQAFEREGAYYLFTLRLIPLVPFFVINAVMGLSRIPARTFWWVSQLGMLPGTIAFVYAGSTFPSLRKLSEQGARGILDWRLILAFAILGILPLILKKLVPQFGKPPKQ